MKKLLMILCAVFLLTGTAWAEKVPRHIELARVGAWEHKIAQSGRVYITSNTYAYNKLLGNRPRLQIINGASGIGISLEDMPLAKEKEIRSIAIFENGAVVSPIWEFYTSLGELGGIYDCIGFEDVENNKNLKKSSFYQSFYTSKWVKIYISADGLPNSELLFKFKPLGESIAEQFEPSFTEDIALFFCKNGFIECK